MEGVFQEKNCSACDKIILSVLGNMTFQTFSSGKLAVSVSLLMENSNQGIICLGKQRPQHSALRCFSKLVHQQLLKYTGVTSTISLLWEINEVLMGLSSFVMVCNMGALGKCTK